MAWAFKFENGSCEEEAASMVARVCLIETMTLDRDELLATSCCRSIGETTMVHGGARESNVHRGGLETNNAADVLL